LIFNQFPYKSKKCDFLLEEKVPQADEEKSNKQKILLFLLLEEKVPQADEAKIKAKKDINSQFSINKTHYHKTIWSAVLLLEEKVPKADEVKS
jgi:hypothetical protein